MPTASPVTIGLGERLPDLSLSGLTLVKTESNAPTGDRVEINYPVRVRSTEQPNVDKLSVW